MNIYVILCFASVFVGIVLVVVFVFSHGRSSRFGELIGWLLVIIGMVGWLTFSYNNAMHRAAHHNDPLKLSPRAQFLQKLLSGEEMPLAGSTLPEVYATVARDLKLPESDARKLGDIRRYTIRFNPDDKIGEIKKRTP